ncbi:MAG: hypothetical protein JO103_11140 [Candidatus Eremiobacteraeota bacterium]|nr:hypothetical protein [Candidatus Eremiobacteraeota bacterium]MBV9409478.1 hypothetical protein [Candidatus Eremiobacteraeota bacterium]
MIDHFDDLDLREEPTRGNATESVLITTVTVHCTRTTVCTDSCCTTCMVGPG